jgi:hypothetical protein
MYLGGEGEACSGYVERAVISGANKDSVSAYFKSESKSLILRVSYLAELYQKEMYLCRLTLNLLMWRIG